MCELTSPVWTILLASGLSSATLAGEIASPAAKPPQTLWTRETLTGDWGGFRRQLGDHGMEVALEFTEFYQGMVIGTGDDDFEFAERADAWLGLDSGKLGLYEGGGVQTHLTYRSGDLPGRRGGALWPVNTGATLPLQGDDNLIASSIYYRQRLGPASLMVGKINAVDLLARDPFFGGWGIHRFMNIAFVAPPSGVVPRVIMGGIVVNTVGVAAFPAALATFIRRGKS